jgi:uncharacterized protein (TIGR02001 family)
MNRFLVLMGAALALWAAPALAQDDTDAPTSAFDVSGTATLTSDYVFRGVSLSDNDPAVQGSLEVQHVSGVYAGVWGSSIARYAGTHVETDVYGGWRGAAGGLDLDLGAVGYVYPGGHGANYVELAGKAAKTLGPLEAEAGIAWAPSQKTIGGRDNLYLFGSLSSGIPGTPITITADVGHEKGSMAGPSGKKWDWGLTADYVRGPVILSVSYKDSDIRRALDPDKIARSRVMATVTLSF